MGVLISAPAARRMYPEGRGNAAARRWARFWVRVIALGVLPRRWVVLCVPGRRTGRPTRFPLGMVDVSGRWYLVSMLGPDCNWVRNVSAAGGAVTLVRRRRYRCRLTSVPVAERAPILKRYLRKAPGARPHVPVDRRAPLADFAAVAGSHPVYEVAFLDRAGRTRAGRGPYRAHHRRRLALGSLAALLVLAVAAVAFGSPEGPPPLALPAAAAAPPVGALDGTWTPGPGTLAGFRVRQTSFGRGSDVVARTGSVSGTATVSGGVLTAATFRVRLADLTVNGKPQPQIRRSLDTDSSPYADFALTAPVRIGTGTGTGTVAGRLTLRGVTRAVVFAVAARRDGALLEVAGSAPIPFADWGIQPPTNYGFLGSLAHHGTAEFLLVLRAG